MDEFKKRLARLTTNVLNPFLVSLAMIVLLSFKSISSASDALKWSLIVTAMNILPVFLVVVYLVHNRKLEGIFINARRQRNKIYLLASACAIAGCIILPSLGAPTVILAVYIAALASMVVFMFINLRWKISVHTAFVAAAATSLIVLYGFAWGISIAFLPLITWARVKMDNHSPAQAVTGAVLASVIVVVVFYFFGLVGHPGPA